MKVLHVHSGNLYGGVESFLVTLARARAAAPEMEPLFALSFEGRLSTELVAAGVKVEPLGPVRLSRPWTMMRARARLTEVVATHRPEVAVVHSPWSEVAFGPALARAAVPRALYVHGPLSPRHTLDRLCGWTRPPLAIANSQFTLRSVPAVLPRAGSELCHVARVLESALPSDRARLRAELGVGDAERVIVQVSRLDPFKGHRLHLQALAKLLPVPGWTCWVVGGAQRPQEQAYLRELEQLRDALGLRDRVRFLGERTDVAAILSAADLFCQPNQGPEPFGLTFVEALSAGLPVVSTALGAAPEVVSPDCGRLVPPEPDAVAAALGALLEDAELRARLSDAARVRGAGLCAPAVQLPRLAGLLSSLVATQPSSATARSSG